MKRPVYHRMRIQLEMELVTKEPMSGVPNVFGSAKPVAMHRALTELCNETADFIDGKVDNPPRLLVLKKWGFRMLEEKPPKPEKRVKRGRPGRLAEPKEG